MAVRAQPGLGVVVIEPQPGEVGSRSTGPKHPIPSAVTGPWRSKKLATRSIVFSGVVVGTISSARRSSGPVPTPQTHLEPPASTPP